MAALAAIAGCSTFGSHHDRAYEVSVSWIAGRPTVAWYGGRLAHEAIFLRFADSYGRPMGPPLQLTDATRDAFEPSLQELNGDALVAWYEQEASMPGIAAQQIALLARFNVEGRELWQRQLSDTDAKGRIPVIRVAGGVIHAAWLEQRSDALPMLRVASLDAEGNWLQPPRDVQAVGTETWNLNAAVGSDGVFHVLLDSNLGGGANELHWIRTDAQHLFSRQVTADDGRSSSFPDIAIQGDRAAVVWFDTRDGNEEVYLRCVQLDAGAPPTDLLLDAPDARVTHTTAQSIGAYAIWAQNNVELVWTEVSAKQRQLWRQSFDQHCKPRSAALRVAEWGRRAGIASMSSSSAGLALAWNALRGDTSVVRLKVKVSPNAVTR